jgi:serine/threonine protein kinase/Tfp pilus assembly protein PilF
MSLTPGTRLGPYEVLSPLGAGGMGEVYRARDTRLEREVALKVLGRGLLTDENARKRFRKEAQALAKLNHAHIAQVHDFATEGGIDFLVMELVPGETLSERLARGPLSESEVLKVGKELAEGLSAAHAEGVIHCDLKPANLRLSKDGVLKILDFGLARLKRPIVTGDATAALTGTEIGVSGTLPYMAPEQMRAESLDGRTDLWGAGVVLYELATGTRPFRDVVPARLTDAILHADPDPPAMRRPAVSGRLSSLILKCLEKDPDRRFQSAAELRLGLERLSMGPEPTVVTERQPAISALRWAAAAALVVALASVALVVKPWRTSGKPLPAAAPIASLAVLPLDNMTGDPGQEYFADGMTEALITELAKIRSLKVISRKSVMRFKKSDKPLPEIAKQLGVEGVVEGSVSRSGGRIRVTAQLIRAANDHHLWADSFDRAEADILTLQSDVARAIAGQVRAAVTPDERQRLAQTRKVNPEAYDLALRAIALTEKAGGPEDVRRAVDLAERAVMVDPESAQSHLALATALGRFPEFGEKTGAELRPRFIAAVDRALEIDPTLARAHSMRGGYLPGIGEDVRREFERSIELAPNDGIVRANYSAYLMGTGQWAEGEAELTRAVELDPANILLRCSYLGYLYALRRDPETLAETQRILDLDPNWFWAFDARWRVAFWQGRHEDAIRECRKSLNVVWPGIGPPEGTSWAEFKRWLPEALKARDKKPYSTAGIVAATYAMFGEKEKAFPYLEECLRRGDAWSGQLGWPDFDSLRDDPRFEAAVVNSFRENWGTGAREIYGRTLRKPTRELAEAALGGSNRR